MNPKGSIFRFFKSAKGGLLADLSAGQFLPTLSARFCNSSLWLDNLAFWREVLASAYGRIMAPKGPKSSF